MADGVVGRAPLQASSSTGECSSFSTSTSNPPTARKPYHQTLLQQGSAPIDTSLHTSLLQEREPVEEATSQSLKGRVEGGHGQHRLGFMTKIFGWLSTHRLSNSPQDSLPSSDFLFKLVLVGDHAVGKLSIMRWLTTNSFQEALDNGSIADVCTHKIQLDSNTIQLQIWDLTSADGFKTVRADLYKAAHGILVIYDVTRLESFANLHQWLEEVNEHKRESATVFVIGNKIDEIDKRVVNSQAAESVVEKMGFLYEETSAKTGANIGITFRKVASEIKKRNARELAAGGMSGKQEPIFIKPSCRQTGPSTRT